MKHWDYRLRFTYGRGASPDMIGHTAVETQHKGIHSRDMEIDIGINRSEIGLVELMMVKDGDERWIPIYNEMYDTAKRYRTRSGHDVIGLTRKIFNGVGRPVTYPLKGTLRRLVNGRHRNEYCIWSSCGRKNVLPGYENHPDDLVEVR